MDLSIRWNKYSKRTFFWSSRAWVTVFLFCWSCCCWWWGQRCWHVSEPTSIISETLGSQTNLHSETCGIFRNPSSIKMFLDPPDQTLNLVIKATIKRVLTFICLLGCSVDRSSTTIAEGSANTDLWFMIPSEEECNPQGGSVLEGPFFIPVMHEWASNVTFHISNRAVMLEILCHLESRMDWEVCVEREEKREK